MLQLVAKFRHTLALHPAKIATAAKSCLQRSSKRNSIDNTNAHNEHRGQQDWQALRYWYPAADLGTWRSLRSCQGTNSRRASQSLLAAEGLWYAQQTRSVAPRLFACKNARSARLCTRVHSWAVCRRDRVAPGCTFVKAPSCWFGWTRHRSIGRHSNALRDGMCQMATWLTIPL